MRRYGDPARKDQSYRTRPGAYGVLLRGRDVLLTHQMAPYPEFQLPGGGIDPGESPVQALHREVFEETGWRIDVARKVTIYRRFVFMPEYDQWAEKICHIFLARPVRPHGPPRETGHTAVWMPLEFAAQVVASQGDRAVLSGLMASAESTS